MRVKKISAILAAVAVILPLIPARTARANQQNNVTSISIIYQSRAGYSANLRYYYNTSPAADTNNNFYLNGIGGADPANPDPANYTIFMRNVSAGGANKQPVGTGVFNAADDGRPITRDINLSANAAADGSLYSFTVEPEHTHTYRNQTGTEPGTGLPIYGPSYSQRMVPVALPPEVLYMTDLRVEGEGRGSRLNVIWDSPTYLGNNIFTGYDIYYIVNNDLQNLELKQQRFSASVRVPLSATSAAAPDPSRPGVTRRSYTINDESLVPGATYAISVEPYISVDPNSGEVDPRDHIRSRVTGDLHPTVPTQRGRPDAELSLSGREYRTNTAKVSFPLDWELLDEETIRLIWNKITPPNDVLVDRIVIMACPDDKFDPRNTQILGTLYGEDAKNVTSFATIRPGRGETMYYKIVVYYTGDAEPMPSDIAMYNPSVITVTPNKPEATASGRITLDWSAFVRPAMDGETPLLPGSYGVYAGLYQDKNNMTYDIWIADAPETETFRYSSITKALDNMDALGLQASAVRPGEPPGYTRAFTQYYNVNLSEMVPITGNRMYYIKIVAKKTAVLPGGVVRVFESDPCYLAYFVPPDGEIARPPALSKPPLSIRTDSDGIEQITQTSMEVQWKRSWYEIFHTWQDENGAMIDGWFSDVAVRADGTLAYGPEILPEDKKLDFYKFTEYDKAQIINLIAASGATDAVTEDMLRIVDMGDPVEYQMRVFPFSELKNMIGGSADYKQFLEKMTNDEAFFEGSDGFHTIVPSGDADGFMYYLIENGVGGFALNPNTPYVILMRAYRTLPDGTRVGYPAYLVATTLPDSISVDVDPTVPTLWLDADLTTETTATVYWLNQSMEGFELAYSDGFLDDPSQARIITAQEIKDKMHIGLRKAPEEEQSCIIVTIEDLFPATGYYVWLRAIGTTRTSSWSNPVFVTTKDIAPPRPPDGLGLAGTDFLDRINKENETEFIPKAPEYLILSWLRDAADDKDPISYDTGGNASAEVLNLPEMLGEYIVKFGGLAVNKPYYIRAKTILTVTKDAGGGLKFAYNYRVQIATNGKFLDCIELFVPPLEPAPASARNFIRKESGWTKTVIIRTGTSDGEYDSDVYPEMIPLPPQDIEIVYDGASDTLTYRFLHGQSDYYVEQRFITRMIQTKTFTYGVDVSKYQNRSVTNRVVEIPYAVFRAFTERKIDFIVIAENMTATFSPGFLETSAVAALPDFGANSKVIISFSADGAGTPEIDDATESFVSTPQSLEVSAVTPSKTLRLDILAEYINIDLRLSNRYAVMDQNVGAYMANGNTGGWTRIAAKYLNETASLNFKTDKAASVYSAIAKDAPLYGDEDGEIFDALLNVTAKLNITDLVKFNPAEPVGAARFNNLAAAVVKGSLSVAMNAPVSDEIINSLTKSGMYIAGTNVDRETGIFSLVKLYELKTKSVIKNHSSLENTPYPDIAGASEKYRAAMLKAGDLGFYGGAVAASPKDEMKFGELIYILDIIIQDAGL